jgi:hypothetical protein
MGEVWRKHNSGLYWDLQTRFFYVTVGLHIIMRIWNSRIYLGKVQNWIKTSVIYVSTQFAMHCSNSNVYTIWNETPVKNRDKAAHRYIAKWSEATATQLQSMTLQPLIFACAKNGLWVYIHLDTEWLKTVFAQLVLYVLLLTHTYSTVTVFNYSI